MIFDTFQAFRSAEFAPKVVIIGSGPAGITVARKLAAKGVAVAIFEAGGEQFSPQSQAFYDGKVIGDPYFELDDTRLRQLGGSSGHWGGWCRLLDAEDFQAKPWVADSGWPIARSDLEPFLAETGDILGLPPLQADAPLSKDIRWVHLIKSEPVRFGEKYRSELAASPNLALVLDTYVTALKGDGTQVSGFDVWSAGAPQGAYPCEYAVVATGGLENSRLLLWSNEQSAGAVVPHAAALGRYWMEHPHFQCGNAVLTDADSIATSDHNDAFFSPTWRAMERKQILNFGIRLIKMPYEGMKMLVANLACTAPGTAEWVSEGLGQRLKCAAQLHMAWEQAPTAENGVQLSHARRDAGGVPRIELVWRKNDLERRTLAEGIRLFGQTLAQADLGRVRMADWIAKLQDYPVEREELGGNHHMGGTRMGTDPTTSVVDRNGAVHGMRNLYVAGSSVFPTSGQCNPTMTIVALACRLGDHLVEKIAADEAVASVKGNDAPAGGDVIPTAGD